MPFKFSSIVVALLLVCASLSAQEQPEVWSWAHRTEVRANYRWSKEERLDASVPAPAPADRADDA